ncbi:MAG: ABC transporter permease subunit [Planctomycetes bacterium]|nr:ABC transporter permease subunit [Planctomycetota bacterium]
MNRCRRFLNNVVAIAANGFREGVRDRILYVFFLFALAVIASAKLIGWVSVGEDIKVVRDIGLASMGLFGVMISIFVGASLVHREIERHTIYTVIARPVGRGEFILGRYLGLLGLVCSVTAAMGLFFTVYQAVLVWSGAAGLSDVEGGAVPFPLVRAQILIIFQFVVLVALAVFFSSTTTPVLSAVFTFLAYVLGHMAGWIYRFSDMVLDKRSVTVFDRAVSLFLKVLYYLVPNLETFDIKLRAVHNLDISNFEFACVLLYGVAYSAAVLLAAYLVLRRRQL